MTSDNPSYSFDATRTEGPTVFMIEGDKVAFLDAVVIPPPGTEVTLPNGSVADVLSSRLDLSNGSQLAMVYVSLSQPRTGIVW